MVMAHQACADFKLGAQYYEQDNFKKAYDEFILAASYGDYDAQYNLAAMYLRGQYGDKLRLDEPVRARSYPSKAASIG